MKLNTLIIIINFYYIFAGEFIDIKKLFLFEKYFVILDTGLYLYDSKEMIIMDEYYDYKSSLSQSPSPYGSPLSTPRRNKGRIRPSNR